jgi:hypothetical protein
MAWRQRKFVRQATLGALFFTTIISTNGELFTGKVNSTGSGETELAPEKGRNNVSQPCRFLFSPTGQCYVADETVRRFPAIYRCEA